MSRKAREIDVWVDPDDFSYGIDYGIWKLKETASCKLKAKLVIDIPEKKIEITESDFDKAFSDSLTNHNNCLDLKKMKNQLGFYND